MHASDAESATVCAWQQSPVVFANVSVRTEFDGTARVSDPKGKSFEFELQPYRCKLVER